MPKSPLDVIATEDFGQLVGQIARFESEGVRAVDHAMSGIADHVLQDARARGGEKYGELRKERGIPGQYVVVAMQQDGRHIANYQNYGTLASRRPKARRPGTKKDHSKPGIRRKRFLRKPTKKVIGQILIASIVEIGERLGFDMRRGI